MNNVVRLALVDPHDASRNSVKTLLLGIDTVWLEAECSRYDFFIDIVNQTQPDIALVHLDGDAQRALALVAQITQEQPACAVFVISSSQEGSLILQAMRNGAKEFLHSPLRLDDFMAALDRLHASTGKKDKARGSKVISICGASGGVGCTSLAINLGCILAQNKANSVVVIDLDVALGDSDVWLDIIPDYTIQDVADNISRLDYSLLKRSLSQHASGAFLLPRPIHMEEAAPINAEQLQRVIALLRATFSHLIIDLSKAYTRLDLAAIQVSDVTLLVTQLDLPCLRNVVRLLQFLDEREMSAHLKVVVNRVGLEDSQISLSKALETIGREVYWQLPNDYATMVESRNNGVPLINQAPRSKLNKSVELLAAQLDSTAAPPITEPAEPADKPKRRLFSFLGNK
ncbi:MAG: AAA family ATPase [Planctomyces sp.]|nr:AAA family ATPase [Planctomyces sp.]